jgi:ABC-2 type transport system ATP-binding protein
MTINTSALAISARAVRKSFGDHVALDGVDLTVAEGTIFALLGPNGAGKSTTVRVLTTLTRPDAGDARVAGIDVLAEPARARGAIGVVGQKQGADLEATGRENLVLQGEFCGITGRELKARVQQSLERFALTEAGERKVKTYSGGMQRRLDIAMGLLHRPRVLFLDEPTTGLDPEARVELWSEIGRLTREERMTILLTTHYMEEADKLASRVAIIDHGRIVAQGSPDQLKDELEGDTIAVRLTGRDAGAARRALAHLDGVDQVTVEDQVVRASARDGAAAIPAVLAALGAQGVEVAAVTVARPTLDDVYLRHAGHSLPGAELEATEVAA